MNPLTPPRNYRRRSRAFTLIELLVVILILAILAALVVPKFLDRAEDAKVAAAQADLAEFNKALETFKLDTGRYPTTEEGLSALYQNPGSADGWKQLVQKPIGDDPWHHPYIYQFPGTSGETSFLLESYGADGAPGGEGRNQDLIENT